MWNLYGYRPGAAGRKLVATFGSEQQLKAYVSWATLSRQDDGTVKFEQGSALVGCHRYESEQGSPGEEHPDVPHNPSPSML